MAFLPANITFDEAELLGEAALAAFEGTPVPAGWSIVTPTELGVAAQYRDGNYFTDPSTDANAIVLRNGSQFIVSFRGTDSATDTANFGDLAPPTPISSGIEYIKHFDPLLDALRAFTQSDPNAEFSFTGASLGGGATNQMAAVVASRYGGYFNGSTFVAFASPMISNAQGIVNLGVENDEIYKLSHTFYPPGSGYPDFTSSADNLVIAIDDYLNGAPHQFDEDAHDDAELLTLFGRLEQSQFYQQMTLDSPIILAASDLEVTDRNPSRVNTGAYYLGRDIPVPGAGGDEHDKMLGRSGDDFMEGFSGNDILSGGLGNDTLFGGAGGDTLHGQGGADILLGDRTVMPTENAGAVTRLYLATLARGPDDGGLANWTAMLDAGTPLNTIATGFVNSVEFQIRYGALDNSQFVTLLYNNVLHRAPDAGGLANWVGSLNGGASRESVVTGFSQSAEFIIASDPELHAGQIYRLYGATLDRQPDSGGFIGWVGALDGGAGLNDVTNGFVGSQEFQNTYGTSLTNTEFVTLLYSNVLDRAPDAGGLAGWVAFLDGGASRTDVVLGFSESQEYQNTTASAFHAYMGTVRPDWNDVIEGGAGNDIVSGGHGADTYFFQAGEVGIDHVYQFESWDTLRFTGYGYADATEPISHMTQSGANVVFGDLGQTITFHGATLADMQNVDWLFV